MRGSLLVTFDEIISSLGTSYFSVEVNNQPVYYGWMDINNLYSAKINTGDVVKISSKSDTSYNTSFSVYRTDYTTDDVYGDRGIKSTFINSVNGNSNTLEITFTATTRPDAYGFSYNVSTGLSDCLNIGSGFTLTTATGSTRVREVKIFDNKIYVGGRFNKYDTGFYSGMTILNLDGTVYSGFSYNNFGDNANLQYQGITSIEVLPSGKLYVGGSFINYSGVTAYSLVKLNSNGTLDTSFTVGPNYNESVIDIEVQSDNKVMVLGHFTQFSGTSRNGILRLNTDGTLDTSFNPGTGISPISATNPLDMTIQSDGKIIVVGNFTSYNGNARNRIVRINTDGSIDNTFSIGTGFNVSAYSVAVQSDGKVIVCGVFTSYNGTSRNSIIRLNSDGSVDTSFTSPFSAGVICTDNEILSNGKILVATNVSGGTLYRLNSDGSFDNTFNNPQFNSIETFTVETIAVNTDNRIYMGGAFTIFDGISTNRIAATDQDGNSIICGQ